MLPWHVLAPRKFATAQGWAKQLQLQHVRSIIAVTGQDPYGAPPEPPRRRVVVTGLGAVTPLGVGVRAAWQRLLAGHTAVRTLQPEDLPEAHRKSLPELASRVAACVPQDEFISSRWAPGADSQRLGRFAAYAVCAAGEALHDAQWLPTTDEARRETGVAIGAGMSSTSDLAEAGVLQQQGKLRRLSPYFVPRILVNMAAGAVSIKYGLQGPNHAASTACATGVHSIGDAYRLVRNGDAEVMVAGGTESCIDAISMAGFSRLKALSTRFNDCPAKASRPFDAQRDGFVIGEGAACLVLEDLQHALARGADMYAEVRGYGLSGDAHHITQPPPDGRGARVAMEAALAEAGLAPEDVAYINAHATSTPLGDAAEQRAIADAFGQVATNADAPGGPVLVSSTKGAHGHLLGAAGAVEAVFAVLAMVEGMAPPTVNLEQPDPPLLAGLVAGEARKLRPGPCAVMTNSFGFGGTNASLVFATPPTILDPIVDGTP